MRLYIPFKSPLFIKYTLQPQYSRYPHFHRLSPPTQLKCGTVQFLGKSLFSRSRLVGAGAALIRSPGGLGTATRCPWENVAKLPPLPVKQGIGIAAYLGQASSGLAAERMVRCRPRALGCKGGEGNPPPGGAGDVFRTREMLSVEGTTRLQGTALTQEQL